MANTVKIMQKIIIPATPMEVYEAYVDGKKQTEFTAWDGYIKGKYLELEPGRKIVQEWTSTDFAEGTLPSRFEITLKEAKGGTELTMIHSGVPEEAAEDIGQGWKDYYWEPMKKYFKERKN